MARVRAPMIAAAALVGIGCSFIDDYGRFHVRADGGASDGGASDGGVECGVEETRCASGCVSLASNGSHCGTCDNACAAGEHCVSGECRIDCPEPYTVCVVGTAEECIDTATRVAHCGGCGQACSTTHALSSCNEGRCELTCEEGYDDCDGDVSTGCEQALDVAAHCGRCGAACLEGIECVGPATCGDRPVEVDVGERHGCIRNAAGDVLCWGRGTMLKLASPLARLRDAGPATAISVGATGSCAALAGGVRCWMAHSPTTATEHDLTGVLALESGGATFGSPPGSYDSHCAVRGGGELLCWGRGFAGMLGVPERVSTPMPPGDGDARWVSDVGVAAAHLCEVTTLGTVRCRGGNTQYQLGYDGPDSQTSIEVDVPGRALRVTAGTGIVMDTTRYDGHSVVLLEDGRIFQWGLGIAEPSEITAEWPTEADVVDVDAGRGFTCARVDSAGSGEVWCWGRNEDGQLGDGTLEASPDPVPVARLGDVATLSVGHYHSCVIETDGAVRCWGSSSNEALGARRPFDAVWSVSGVAELALGMAPNLDANHSCLRYATGQMRCWGSNTAGQLASPTAGDADVPGAPIGERVGRIATGDRFTCAARPDGTVRCWGHNDRWQLGTATEGPAVERATDGAQLRGVIELAAGTAHVCALVNPDFALGQAAIWCWGDNAHFQLGVEGDTRRLAAPVPGSPGFTGMATMISAGDGFTCAIDTTFNRQVWCWGNALDWRLGVEPSFGPDDRSAPQRIVELGEASWIASGRHHSCAIARAAGSPGADAQVWCWGHNGTRMVGTGVTQGIGRVDPTLDEFTGTGGRPPTVVALPLMSTERPVELALGELMSCALTDLGRVLCWGDDGRGQLGRGTGVDPRTPAEVPGLDAVHLAVGSTQVCAVTRTSDVVCWGQNRSGELGYGHRTTLGEPGPPLELHAP